MSPIHIDEVDPITRQRALEQIEETGGVSTALAVNEPKNHPTYTPVEMRARSILSRMESLSAKLKTLEDDIRALWLDFDNLKTGETILGCATKAEFCERRLNRTPRAIQYMLAGGNTNRPLLPAHETFSPPPAPEPPPVSNREAARQEYKKAHPESSADSNHDVDKKIRKDFQQRSEATPETHWISPGNHCPTGKRGFASIEELYAARKAEGKPQPVAYIGCCGQCRQVHLDKDQRTDTGVHLTFYIPPEIQDDADYLKKFFASHTDDQPPFPPGTQPAENPDADIEGVVLALPDSSELDEAVNHPPEISAPKQSQPAKPNAKVESRLKKVQREWASVTNPAIGRITVTASNVSSGVETSSGRFDLLLSGVSPQMLNTLRAVLPTLSKEWLDRIRELIA